MNSTQDAPASTTTPTTGPVLVTGGTGKTGRRVAAGLAARGVGVRVGSRAGDPPFDWADSTTWRPALRGARAAYLTYVPDLAAPGAAEAMSTLVDIALDEGVHRLVLLSGRGEEEAQRCEGIVLGSGAAVTVVRASWFAQNFSEGYLLDGVLSGVVALPADAARDPFVDVEDIAEVAVAALTDDVHVGKVYEVTGPAALSFAEAVAEIAAATGREVGFQPVPMSVFTAELDAHGVPPEIVSLLRYLFSEVLGDNESVSDGVERVLGRPAGSFRDFARRAAASGVWSVR
jgi:uncharacterized protein YbjT (DUF2867 family)